MDRQCFMVGFYQPDDSESLFVVTFEGLVNQYRLINPELSKDDLEELARQTLKIHEDVEQNFSKYDKERSALTAAELPSKKHKPVKKRMTVTKDHLGNVYANRRAMCEAYGITPELFHCRYAKGWQLERVLTQPKRKRRTDQEIIEDLIRKMNGVL